MGLIAKAATKKRIQPQSGPLNPSLVNAGPWTTNGGVPAGGLVRSAVLAVDLTGTRSSSLRGRTSAIAAAFAPSYNSNLWVQMTGPQQWSFVLGINNGKGGIAADWSVALRINGAAVEVATGHYLTKDGALVHGEHHDALRNELLRALALGQQPDPHGEKTLSSQSLARPLTTAGAPPSVTSVDFEIRTSLNVEQCWRQLGWLGYRELRRDQDEGQWGLGLPANDSVDRVTLRVTAGLVVGQAEIGSDGIPARRFAATGLRSFIDRSLFLLRSEDSSVRYVGPEEWAGGRS